MAKTPKLRRGVDGKFTIHFTAPLKVGEPSTVEHSDGRVGRYFVGQYLGRGEHGVYVYRAGGAVTAAKVTTARGVELCATPDCGSHPTTDGLCDSCYFRAHEL